MSIAAIGACVTATAPLTEPTPSAVAPVSVGASLRSLTLTTPRAVHTATKLPDGRVLIAGGFDAAGRALSSLELFSPVADAFKAAGVMTIPRHSHTATLLADGRVLIAGGYDGTNTRTATAEIYDPRTDAIVQTGRLLAPRADHSAARLEDGRVLIVGGTGPGTSFLATAEVFDPATMLFVATGPMTEPRESNTLTTLSDGRVLVAGGHHGRAPSTVVLSTALLFDPKSGEFTPTGAMGVRRHKHDAVRLADGSVLVIAGSDERDDRGAYATAERYDPRTGTFGPAAPLAESRYKLRDTTVLMRDGRVLVSGGASRPELYSPVGGSSTTGLSFGRAPLFGTATLLDDGRVLAAGGYSLTGPASRAAWLLSLP